MEEQVEVIKSNKGGMKVIHKGYMYTVHKKRQCGGIRWRCAQRSLHCKGSISTGTDEGPPKVNMPHNHLPDLHSVALARGRQFDDVSPLLDVKCEETDRAESVKYFSKIVNKMADSSSSSACPRKSRKSNFSPNEVNTLVEAIRSHYGVLYGKFSNRATNRWIRQRAWLDILRKVNGVSVEKRTLQEVKNKWKKSQPLLKHRVTKGLKPDDSPEPPWEDVVYDKMTRKYVKYSNKHSEPMRKYEMRVRKPKPPEETNDLDSMPLQERLSKTEPSQHKSQPLSPTKLKVTRQPQKVPERPPSPPNEEMCLRWNSHHSNMQTAFPSILLKEQYVDVTLAAEGKTLKCHRLILSSCSPYFEEILSGISPLQHPVLFMRDIPFWILKSLCDFMYAGEVHICQNRLEELLAVAEALRIKGLAGKSTPPEDKEKKQAGSSGSGGNNSTPIKRTVIETTQSPHDYDEDLIDPLDLLEPLYEEVAEEKKPPPVVKPKEVNKFTYQTHQKKMFPKRIRKRKYSEPRDPSPPPVFTFRKGTRSRPNVKIPKYYHSDFANTAKANQNCQMDPLMDICEIKTEPIDVEDNLIEYSDEEGQFVEETDGLIITARPADDQFRRIKLSNPIITQVETVEEGEVPAGGLEVIKITLPEEIPEKTVENELGNNNKVTEEAATAAISTSLDHLEKEAMNVVNAINMENNQPVAE